MLVREQRERAVARLRGRSRRSPRAAARSSAPCRSPARRPRPARVPVVPLHLTSSRRRSSTSFPSRRDVAAPSHTGSTSSSPSALHAPKVIGEQPHELRRRQRRECPSVPVPSSPASCSLSWSGSCIAQLERHFLQPASRRRAGRCRPAAAARRRSGVGAGSPTGVSAGTACATSSPPSRASSGTFSRATASEPAARRPAPTRPATPQRLRQLLATSAPPRDAPARARSDRESAAARRRTDSAPRAARQPRQPHHKPHRRRRQRRVDDHRQRGMPRDDLFDRLRLDAVAHRRIDDQQVASPDTKQRMQLRRVRRRIQGMGCPRARSGGARGDDGGGGRRRAKRGACGWVSQKPGFLSQNAGLRDAPRPYVRETAVRQLFVPTPESPMSRRHLTFVVVAIASLAISACNSSPTGPRPRRPPTMSSPRPPTAQTASARAAATAEKSPRCVPAVRRARAAASR